MGCLQNAVFAWKHRFSLLLGWFAPEQEYHIGTLRVYDFNHMVSKFLPATLSVRVGLAILYGQTGIQEKDSLFGPFGEISVGWSFLEVFVGNEVFVHVFKRWGRWYWFEYTETKSMGLIGLMVGVLSNNDNFDVGDRGRSECIKDVLLFRIDLHTFNATFLPDQYSCLTNLQIS